MCSIDSKRTGRRGIVTMLPERSRPATYTNASELVADHYGVTNPK